MSVPFAFDAHGNRLTADLHRYHTILAGATRSGKSATSYVLLAGASCDPSIAIVGCDPSSLLLAPFEDAGQSQIVTGTRDLPAMAASLEALVQVMDERIAILRALGVDKFAPSPQRPTVLVVMEEYAGTLAACETYDAAQKPADRIKPKVLGAVGRLLREGAKAQIFVFTIIQRPDASILGGADRAQYSRRITHRLDNADGVRMLNEDTDLDTTSRLMSARPGVGLLNEAGEPLRFFKSVLLEYPAFVGYVRSNYRPKALMPATDTRKEVRDDDNAA